MSTPPRTIDLRGHDWEATPMVALDADWQLTVFQEEGDAQSRKPTYGNPTQLWQESEAQNPDGGKVHRGKYALRILLDPDPGVQLAIDLEEVLTAYALSINGRRIGGNGLVGDDEAHTVPALAPQCFALPTGLDTLHLEIACANYSHRQGGITATPRIGQLPALQLSKTTRTTMGGILLGLLLMGSMYQFMRYVHRRQEIGFLVNGLWSLSVCLHLGFLHERWLYQLIGSGHWALCYRLELISLFFIFLISFVLLRIFFPGRRSRWISTVAGIICLLGLAFISVTPIWLTAKIDYVIPAYALMIIVAWVAVLIEGYRNKVDGAIEIAVATLAISSAAITDRFMFGGHVGGLLPVHYFFSAYIFVFAWILSRRSAASEQQVQRLSEDLAQSNQALEQQNERLEITVQERTAELVQSQQAAHDLEMEQVRRDLESVSLNNQMKVQLTRNLIEQLQGILQAGGDHVGALKSLVASLRGQVATEERLAVLQDDFESVNAEFYRRLQAAAPQLSKSEREICAYIKLNLSGKDIAQLRKTSSNTIHVARHRIRRKLGLERDEELEAFIQAL